MPDCGVYHKTFQPLGAIRPSIGVSPLWASRLILVPRMGGEGREGEGEETVYAWAAQPVLYGIYRYVYTYVVAPMWA